MIRLVSMIVLLGAGLATVRTCSDAADERILGEVAPDRDFASADQGSWPEARRAEPAPPVLRGGADAPILAGSSRRRVVISCRLRTERPAIEAPWSLVVRARTSETTAAATAAPSETIIEVGVWDEPQEIDVTALEDAIVAHGQFCLELRSDGVVAHQRVVTADFRRSQDGDLVQRVEIEALDVGTVSGLVILDEAPAAGFDAYAYRLVDGTPLPVPAARGRTGGDGRFTLLVRRDSDLLVVVAGWDREPVDVLLRSPLERRSDVGILTLFPGLAITGRLETRGIAIQNALIHAVLAEPERAHATLLACADHGDERPLAYLRGRVVLADARCHVDPDGGFALSGLEALPYRVGVLDGFDWSDSEFRELMHADVVEQLSRLMGAPASGVMLNAETAEIVIDVPGRDYEIDVHDEDGTSETISAAWRLTLRASAGTASTSSYGDDFVTSGQPGSRGRKYVVLAGHEHELTVTQPGCREWERRIAPLKAGESARYEVRLTASSMSSRPVGGVDGPLDDGAQD